MTHETSKNKHFLNIQIIALFRFQNKTVCCQIIKIVNSSFAFRQTPIRYIQIIHWNDGTENLINQRFNIRAIAEILDVGHHINPLELHDGQS